MSPRSVHAAFTLIELLVVIAIIGLLASVVLASLATARERGQFAKIKSDLHSMEIQLGIARYSAGKTAMQITGNSCSACGFYSTSVKVLNSDATRLATLRQSWQRLGFSDWPLDPWGTPYLIDENEHEFSGTDCRYDWILSAGKNGVLESTIGSTGIIQGDDYERNMPFVFCQTGSGGADGDGGPVGSNNI